MEPVCRVLEENLGIDYFNRSDRKDIMTLVYSYMLGIDEYSTVYKELREYWAHNVFSNTLRIIPDKQIYYVLDKLRPYVKTKGKLNTIHIEDKEWLDSLTFCRWRIKLLKDYPKLEESLEKVKPKILNYSQQLNYKTFKYDAMYDVQDITTMLKMKAVQAYKTYIYSYNMRNWNDNVFYSCIVKSINTKGIDMNKKYYNNTPTFDEQNYYNDNYDLHYSVPDEYLLTPEQIMMIKELKN